VTSFPVILSAPSGAGKTTIAQRVVSTRRDVGYSISATTRARREYEEEGKDYFFLSPEEFERRRLAGLFAESAEVHGRWYGTLKSEVERVLAARQHVLMDIDVQGARSFRQVFPDSVLIFVLPPSVEALVERLRMRQTETDESIRRRLRTAMAEMVAVEEYDYIVVNEDLEHATGRVAAIIDAESSRIHRAGNGENEVAGVLQQLRRDILLQS
jgi:guanylate kinase